MDKHSRLIFCEHDIGLTGKVLAVQSEAVASSMKYGADLDLGRSVTPFDQAHVPAAPLLVDAIQGSSHPLKKFQYRSRDLRSQERWYSIAYLLVLRRTRSCKEVVIGKCLQTGCFADGETSALCWIVMNVVVPVF